MHPKFEPLFSIITVCYNAASTIEDTLQSVVAQTYHRVEYIIIDGKSTDGTLSIVHRYANRVHTLVSEPDKGLYDAMNKGLSRATGDYVCFLNAGDCFHQADTLHRIATAINRNGFMPDVVYGHTAIVDSHRHFLRMRHLAPPRHLTWRSFEQGMSVCHQAFFARRELCPPYDLSYRFSADFDWCIRVLKQSATTLHTQLTLIDYLDEGLTGQNRKASLKERFRIMVHHYGICRTVVHHLWFATARLLGGRRGRQHPPTV